MVFFPLIPLLVQLIHVANNNDVDDNDGDGNVIKIFNNNNKISSIATV